MSPKQPGRPRSVPAAVDSMCEHSNESFAALIDAIKALGFDEKMACRYAGFIGDTPIIAEDGKILVEDDEGRDLARLQLDFFGPRPPLRRKKSLPCNGQPGALYCLADPADFNIRTHPEAMLPRLTDAIAALGYDAATAARFARLIVKNPCRDHEGKIVVISVDDDGLKELAHLDLELLSGELVFEWETEAASLPHSKLPPKP